ncbi:transposase InsO family protein [Paraburkholderia caledonica]|uniref:Transposase InsO family protein n=1 Tax=Paraburkholderia caledonica TaxID=134536 RepID=A0AB73IPC6_9BURK|nr:transposase InsO family protein [Paraburkholderia caledonica]
MNVKRVHPCMRDHHLLRRPGQRGDTRRHDGRIAIDRSDVCGYSDGSESRCDDGSLLRMIFALDCHDREAVFWAATTGGHSGDVVRDVMLAAVEQRFGPTQADAPIEWLSGNGSAYIDHRTPSFARVVRLTASTRSPMGHWQSAPHRSLSPIN